MSQIKGKQIKDNSLDLEKIQGGSKILPNTSTFGTDKSNSQITDSREFTTKDYVDEAINGATVSVDNGLINTNGTIGLGGTLTKDTTIDGYYDLNLGTSVDNEIDNVNIFSKVTLNNNLHGFNIGGTGFNGGNGDSTFALHKQSNGKIIVGGYLTTYNTITCSNIIRINSDGTFDGTFNTSGSGFNDGVFDIKVLPNDKLLVGGEFTTYNGINCPDRMVRLNSDGTIDGTFNTSGSGFNNRVATIEVLADGKILVGGNFTNYNGVSTTRSLIRLNSDGTKDNTFTLATSGQMRFFKLQPDSKILVCFSNGLKRFNSDGSADTTFNSNSKTFGFDVQMTDIQSDGKIIVVGSFTTYDSLTYNRMIRLNSDGTIDNTFVNVGQGFDNTVASVKVQADDKILVGGNFTQYNGIACQAKLTRLNSDGTIDTTFNVGGTGINYSPNTVYGGVISKIVIENTGNISILGTFDTYNDFIGSNGIMRLDSNGTLLIYNNTKVSFSGVGALRYENDYSNQYTNRTLVDKEYVDGAITASNITITAGNGISMSTAGTAGVVVSLDITDYHANNNIQVSSDGNNMNLLSDGGNISIESNAGNLNLDANGGNLNINSLNGQIAIGGDNIQLTSNSITNIESAEVVIATNSSNALSINGSGIVDIVSSDTIFLTAPTTDISGSQLNLTADNLIMNSNNSIELTCSNGSTTINSAGNIELTTINGINLNGSVASYDADYSSSYTARSLVDKAYVDTLASGIDPKESVKIATNLDLTGGLWSYTIDSVLASGSQDTLDFSGTLTTTDLDNADTSGYVLADGDRILVKNQTDAKQNGIYVFVEANNQLIRATDQDGSPANEVSGGNFTFVEQGTYANLGFVLQGDGNLTLNTDELNWVQFSGAGQITAGNGLYKSDNTLSLNIVNYVTDTNINIETTSGNTTLTTSNNLNLNADGRVNISATGRTYIEGQDDIYIDSYNGNSISINANGAGASIDLFSSSNLNIYGEQGGFSIYTDGTTYQDNGTNGGIKYYADYSADFLDRSLVDKAYVDTQINNSNSTTGNGLSINNGIIELGGLLNKDTVVSGTNSLSFGQNNSELNSFDIYSKLSLSNTYGFNFGGTGFDAQVRFINELNNGKLLVGGNFTNYNGTSLGRLAKLNSDGSLDTTFNSGSSGFNDYVQTIQVQSDDKILVGGNFTSYNGISCPRGIVRLNSDGTYDSTFNNGGAGILNFYVYNIIILPTNKILISGAFITYNGTTKRGIARLNDDGTLDTTFNNGGVGFDTNNAIPLLKLQSDGKIIVGGVFTSYNGTALSKRLIRLNDDGTLDNTFNSGGSGFNNFVNSLLILSDDSMLVGGAFTTFNGVNTPDRLIKLNSDGSLDSSFNSGGTGFDNTPFGLSLQSDGKIIAAGNFTTYNSINVPDRLVRLNSDGTLDSTFNNSGTGFNAYLNFVKINLDDDSMFVAGNFTTYNGSNAVGRIAKIQKDGEIDIYTTKLLLNGYGGLRYEEDISSKFTDRTLVDKAYVDANTNIDLSSIIVDNFYLQSSSGAYLQIESGAYFDIGATAYFDANQVYLSGAASVGIETPSTNIYTDNFNLFINPSDAQSIIINETDFIVKAPNSILYDGDYSANFTDRSLVDKAYVDSIVGSGSLNDLRTIKVTGSGISGTSGIVSYLGTITFPANAITDAEVFVNGIKIDVPIDAYFGTSGNTKPVIGQTLYFDLDQLGYEIDSNDRIQITYLT